MARRKLSSRRLLSVYGRDKHKRGERDWLTAGKSSSGTRSERERLDPAMRRSPFVLLGRSARHNLHRHDRQHASYQTLSSELRQIVDGQESSHQERKTLAVAQRYNQSV